MNTLSILTRLSKPFKRNPTLYLLRARCTSKKGDDDDKKSEKTKRSAEALDKLNSLLKRMVEDDVVSKSAKLNLAKPKGRYVEKPKSEDVQTSAEDKIVGAVKDVAQSLGGDAKQIESELLAKLLNADKQAASSDLSDVIKGMKIDRGQKPAEDVSRAGQVKNALRMSKGGRGREETPQREHVSRRTVDRRDHGMLQREQIDLFGGTPLGIFSADEKATDAPSNTWKRLEERELRLAVTHPPSNYLQQMILWTEQGRIWKFPIDNEQGMEDEQKVYFAEHIFLDKHLEPWCPPRGPLRHFMELVCVGLSKNPYMSVDDKKEHIEWYRAYFEEKKSLLREVGAVPTETQKQIDV